MLILSRYVNDGVVITTPEGRRIEVIVAEVRDRDGRVRLGFTAEREITVHRTEIQAEIDRQRPDGGQPR